jgi:hypothetical protein
MNISLPKFYTYIIYTLIIPALIGCKSISIQNETQKRIEMTISIGALGIDKDYIIEKDYNTIALPNYENPIKLKVSSVEFKNTSYKGYEKASETQSSKINIVYSDTLLIKPKYLKLEISDRLEILNNLKDETNQDAFEFLKNNPNTHMVTSIAIAFNPSQLDLILTAEEVFLEPSGLKNYSLNLYANGKKQHVIQFNEGIVFAYQTSNCCWKQNDKYQLEIIDLVESNDKCPSNSYLSPNRAKKKINYYKF